LLQRAASILLLLLYAVFLAFIGALLQTRSAHTTSRLATIDSLVTRGTFAINDSLFSDTIDRVKIGSNYYSHQPPAHAVLASIVYLPMYHLGIRLRSGWCKAYGLLIFFTNGLATIGALLLFYRSLELLKMAGGARVLLTAAVACGTLILPYSTTINVHGLDAAILFGGFYYFLRGGTPDAPRRWMLLSGLGFSLAASMEHDTVLVYGAFALLLPLRRRPLTSLLYFLLPSLVTLVPTAAYYYVIGGSIKPFAARPELFSYPGSVWTNPAEPGYEQLTGAVWNSPKFALNYGLLCLFGPRGFLIYNPLLWVALFGLLRTLRHRLPFWREGLAITAASALIIAYFSFASTNYGGGCYSIRWFVPLLFLWWFFAAAAYARLASRKWGVTILAALSVFYAAAGVIDPWRAPSGYATPVVRFERLLVYLAADDRLPKLR
jgi:hypothetical protein